ncbi:MAG: chorismate-binding protein [Bdellovibrionales bacterium]|nr:chorismate-binding protein [Bdellovibrionales bacterium]
MSNAVFSHKHWVRSGAFLSSGKGLVDVAFGVYQNCTGSRVTEPRWFSPNDFFDLSSADFKTFEHNVQIAKQDLLNVLPEGEKPNLQWRPAEHQQFEEQFLNVQKSISDGDVEKVVPYVFEHANCEIEEKHLQYFVHRILQSEARGFGFGLWDLDEGQGVFGLTPELLFEIDENSKMTTMALAGTARDDSHNLLQDSKELAEHNLVIEGMKQSFLAMGYEPQVGETYEWSAGDLRHLRTDISVDQFHQINLRALQSLHPTPALGGAPRDAALGLLKDFNNSLPRYSFGAPFGLQKPSGESLFVVQIRCLIFREGRLYLGSGCGVVKSSQLEREWAELSRKRNSVKKAMGLE